MEQQARLNELKAEIIRISAKLKATSDPDVAEALRFKLEALSKEGGELEVLIEQAKEASEVAVEPSEELPEAEIEKLIRAARAHFAAERKPALREALATLEKAAPNHPDVLELKADQLISAKDFVNAVPVLKKARKIAPKSKSIEEKLAQASLKAAFAGSIESQLKAGLSDSPFIGEGDMGASPTAATFASLFLPGAGHLFIGQTVKGVVYLCCWFLFMVPLLLIFKAEFIRSDGRNFEVSMPMICLSFLALMTYMLALFELASLAKRGGVKREIKDRPRPPVDLPFE